MLLALLSRPAKVLHVVCLATVLAVVIGAVTYIEQISVNRAQRTSDSQTTAVVQGCVRNDIRQAQDNRNQYADYLYDLEFLTLLTASPNVKHTKQVIAFTKPLRAAIRSKEWTPLTNCAPVIQKHGVSYKPPQPIPFYKELPTKAALTVR